MSDKKPQVEKESLAPLIPFPIKQLTSEELSLLVELEKQPVYPVIQKLINNELIMIKEGICNIEPTSEVPDYVDNYQRGKLKGRMIGCVIIPTAVKSAGDELKERAKKKDK